MHLLHCLFTTAAQSAAVVSMSKSMSVRFFVCGEVIEAEEIDKADTSTIAEK